MEATSANSSSRHRIEWIDAARGLGIILVVLGHVERGLVAANIAHGPIWSWMDYGLYTFHMPLFFVLAGVNVPASLAKGQRRFLLAKLQTIAWPYVLWSIIQGATLVELSSFTNGHAQLSDIFEISWRPMAQFWFLYVLMICQLLAIVLMSRPRLLAVIAVTTLVLASILPPEGLVEEFCHSFPFFVAGIFLSKPWHAWPLRGDAWLAGAAAMGLAVMIPVSGLLDGMNFDSALALPATVCGILMMVSVSRLLRGRLLAASVLLGRVSMSIYVMHLLTAAGTRIVLVRLGVPANPWLLLALCTAAGVIPPAIAHHVLARLRLLGVLGLAPFKRREAGRITLYPSTAR